jgi:hypothetical protein
LRGSQPHDLARDRHKNMVEGMTDTGLG